MTELADTTILRCDNLAGYTTLVHGFYTSAWGDAAFGGGSSWGSGEGNDNIPESRRRVAKDIGVSDEKLLSCLQIHSADVATVFKPWGVTERPRADAMVTNVPGLALGILTADCVPVLFASPKTGVIGAAHAGWRGAISGVLENTVLAMEKLGARKGNTLAAIGPCIQQKSYEVGPEFPAPFLAEDSGHLKFFRPSPRDGHYMFDLPGYVAAKLRALGLPSVDSVPGDTCSDEDRFFSYRRSCLTGTPRGGSLISVIALGGKS